MDFFATLLGDQAAALVVGAFLLATYQAAKFAELDVADPITSRYVARFPGVKAKDFVGAHTYRLALLAFLAVSLLLYFAACQISAPILSGALKILTGNSQLPPNVPCPLYIAALFMGLTQPVIPVLARLGEAQRNFFHNRIEIPRQIIDLTADLTVAIDRRSVSKGKLAADKLAAELRNLISDDWLASLGRCGDLAFYQQQLDKVQLDPGTAEKTLEEASPESCATSWKSLFFFNLIAVARKSGPKHLAEIVQQIDPTQSVPPSEIPRFVSDLLLSGFLCLLAVQSG